jgi:hypothetical protein
VREKRRIPESEAALVEAFCSIIEKRNSRIDEDRAKPAGTVPDHWLKRKKWTIYPEACSWDLVLAEEQTGVQIGIEAKLCLNAKVLSQALAGASDHSWHARGPDYRAVLVPGGGRNLELSQLCDLIGLTVLSIYDCHPYGDEPQWNLHSPSQLPDEDDPSEFHMAHWHSWLPIEREKLPDYIPDVKAGVKSPVQLTEWKVRAIKLWILLDKFGKVTRGDMKALGLSPTRFTDRFNGFLKPDPSAGGYVRYNGSPDFRSQHPRNYSEIEADFEKWCPPGYKMEAA